jgi:hypothetical protein
MSICPTCQQAWSDGVEFCPRDGAQLTGQATETEAHLAVQLSRRFRIVRRLGEGAMGSVFLAEQIAVGNRNVAFKVLNCKLLDDPDFLLRFRMKRLPLGAFITPTLSPFTNPAKPMTARPTSPWSFWRANPSVRPSSGARFPWRRTRHF